MPAALVDASVYTSTGGRGGALHGHRALRLGPGGCRQEAQREYQVLPELGTGVVVLAGHQCPQGTAATLAGDSCVQPCGDPA